MTDCDRLAKPSNQRVNIWLQFRSHKGALLGGITFIAIIATVCLGPLLWPYDATSIDIRARNQSPNWAHPFGTGQLRRDTLARMMARDKPRSQSG